MSGSKVIALIDCDSFFVSCEQLFNPALKGKPVCVLSNNDGCVVARSKEAKELGIRMGMPAFMAKKEFPQAYYLSGRIDLYGDISNRVMAVLSDFTPVVEVYSIDEAFIDLTGLRRLYKKDYVDIARDIREEINRRVGIPVSIGVSKTKTLAKLASERAKSLGGVYKIGSRDINTELQHTDLIDIWGIGSNTAAYLNKHRIYNAYEFVKQSDAWISKVLGKKGLDLKQELLGISVYEVCDEPVLPKSIQKTSSFANFTSDEQYIKSSLNYHIHRACKKLRKLEMKAGLVDVMLRTKDFRVFHTKQLLVHPTDWEMDIFSVVDKVFKEIYIPNILYRSSGVTLGNLVTNTNQQLSLFNPVESQSKFQKLAQVWDKLECKYGRNIVSLGRTKEDQ